MPKPDPVTGERNLIRHKLVKLRQKRNWSQRNLSYKAQLAGCDMDKNAITRIENNRRYVTDMELIAFAEIFNVSLEYFLDGEEEE